jgi:AcrR family transcriptional regulator
MSLQQQQQILDAAERLIKSETGKQFTMERLVTETQVSRATIYRRFGSKQGLLKRLAEERDLPLSSLEQPDARTRIIQAARTVCGKQGILNTTMEQIAAEADVGIATVYRHFGDKDSLIRTFIDEESPHKLIRAMNISHSPDIEANLLQIVTEMLIFLQENQDFLRMTFMSDSETQDYLTQIREAPNRTLYRLTEFFKKEIAAGSLKTENPQNMAAALLGITLSFGVMVPLFYDNIQTQDPAEKAKFIVSLFLDGLRQENN